MPGFINRQIFNFVSSAIFIAISVPALSQPGREKSFVDPAEKLNASANTTFTSSALTGPVTTFRGSTRDISVVLDGIELTAPNALIRSYGNVDRFNPTIDTNDGSSKTAFEMVTRTPSNAFAGSANAKFSDGNSYTLDAVLTGPIIQERLFFGLEVGLRTTDGYYRNTFLNSDVVDDNSDIHAGARLFFTAYDNANLDFKANWMRSRSGGGGYDGVFALPTFSNFLNQPAFNENTDAHAYSFHSNIRPRHKEDTLELSAKWNETMPWATFTAWVLYSDYDSEYASDGTAGLFGAFNNDSFCLSSVADQSAAGNTLPSPQNLNATPDGSIFGAFTSTGCDGTRFQLRNQEDTSTGLQLSGSKNSTLRWRIGDAYQHTIRESGANTGVDTGVGVTRNLFVAAGSGNPTEQLYHDRFTTNTFRAFGQLAYDIAPTLEASAALQYQHVRQKARNLVPTTPRTTYIVHLSGADFIGGGALNPALSLFINPTGNLVDRREAYSQVTPNVKLAWSGLRNTILYTRWSRNFRPGGFNHAGVAATANLFINSALGTNVGVSDQFSRERSQTAEAGFAVTALNDRLSVNGAGYYTNVTNMHFTEYLVTPLGMVSAVNPIDKARIYGGEINASLSIMREVTLFARGNFTSTKIRNMTARPSAVGSDLPFAPEYKMVGGGQVTYPIRDNIALTGGAKITHVGPTSFHVLQCQSPPTQFGVPGDTCATSRGRYTTVDLRIGFEGNNWTVDAFAHNLTNDRHTAEAIVVPELGYTFARPDDLRRVGLEMSFHF